MANVEPIAVLRLSVKTDTSIVYVTSRNTDIEPTTASPPNTPDQHQQAQRNRQSSHDQQVFLVMLVYRHILHRRATGTYCDGVTVRGRVRRDECERCHVRGFRRFLG